MCEVQPVVSDQEKAAGLLSLVAAATEIGTGYKITDGRWLDGNGRQFGEGPVTLRAVGHIAKNIPEGEAMVVVAKGMPWKRYGVRTIRLFIRKGDVLMSEHGVTRLMHASVLQVALDDACECGTKVVVAAECDMERHDGVKEFVKLRNNRKS